MVEAKADVTPMVLDKAIDVDNCTALELLLLRAPEFAVAPALERGLRRGSVQCCRVLLSRLGYEGPRLRDKLQSALEEQGACLTAARLVAPHPQSCRAVRRPLKRPRELLGLLELGAPVRRSCLDVAVGCKDVLRAWYLLQWDVIRERRAFLASLHATCERRKGYESCALASLRKGCTGRYAPVGELVWSRWCS